VTIQDAPPVKMNTKFQWIWIFIHVKQHRATDQCYYQ